MRRAAIGAETDPAHQREQLRIAAIGREYRARDGRPAGTNTRCASRMEWIRTLELVMPVVRLEVLVRRRKAERGCCWTGTAWPGGWKARPVRTVWHRNAHGWRAMTRCIW